MATITLSSTHSTSISQTLAHENKTKSHVRDASFSSYLGNTEEAFILKLGESMRKPSAIITTNPDEEPLYQKSFGRKKNEDGEISVFGAEKYFNGRMDHKEQPRTAVKAKPQNQPIKEDDTVNMDVMKRRTIKLGTPSTCSEVSWNSQSALLPVPLRNPSPSGRFKVNNRNIFATLLGCRCYCLDKKSIDTEEIDGESKAMNYKKNIEGEVVHGKSITRDMPSDPIGLVRIKQNLKPTWIKEEIPSKNFEDVDVNLLKEDCFTFPTSKLEVGNVSFKRKFEEEARRALEVFGSPIKDKEEEEDNIALSLEKKLSMLTWDATPRADQDTPTPNKEGLINNGENNGDNESDSSSDLFEIKSFSSSVNPFFKRQPSDGMSGFVTPSSCYEPSEASIEWSVVTASAANFSVATDYDYPKPTDLKALSTMGGKTNYNSAIASKATTRKDVPKRLPNMLSGCRSQKAVKVIGEAHKIPVKAKIQKSGSLSQIEKFPADHTKVKDFESAHVQHAFATQAFTQLRSDSLFIH